MDKCRQRTRGNLLDTELTPLQDCGLFFVEKFEAGLPMESSGTILSENAGMTYLGNLMKSRHINKFSILFLSSELLAFLVHVNLCSILRYFKDLRFYWESR